MKNILYFLWLSTTLLFYSCKGKETGQEFHGLWQLVQTKNNQGTTNHNSSQSHALRLLSDNTYIHTSNDNTVYESGTWTLIKKDNKLILRKILQDYEIKFNTEISKAHFAKEGDKTFVYHYRNDKLESKDEANPVSQLQVIKISKDVLEIGEENSTIYKYTKIQDK